MNKNKYWLQLKYVVVANKRWWTWSIKCCNGRVKATSNIYRKRSYCYNDAKAFANYVGIEVRSES